MFVKRTLAAGAIALSTAFAANAADIGMLPVTTPAAPPMTVYAPSPSFDWAGPYVGVYGGYVFGAPWIQAGVQAGYNFVRGGFLAGIEAQAGAAIAGGVAFEANLNARLGAILGSSVLLYTEAGIGYVGGGPTFLWTAGGGMEIALGQSMSVFAEGKVLGTFTGGCCAIIAQGGLNWHPGY